MDSTTEPTNDSPAGAPTPSAGDVDDEVIGAGLPGLEDAATRYAVLQGLAEGVNHQIRVVVIGGTEQLEAGQELVLKPFEVDPLSLGDAFKAIAEYLGTDKAKRRGELYKARAEAQKKATAALEAWLAAKTDALAAAQAVEDDVDEAIEEEDDDGA